jgi:major type 1 subunit fimbrin (pilin)
MKFFRIGAAALCVFAAFSASANQADTSTNGSVVFKGKVTASACHLDTDATNKTVELGEVASGVLRSNGSSEAKPFSIQMKDCGIQTIAEMTVKDANAGGNPGKYLRTVAGTGAAEGVAVSIKANGQDVDFSNPASTKIQINKGQAFDYYNDGVSFEAAMVHSDQNATVKAGSVQAQMDYTVEYK